MTLRLYQSVDDIIAVCISKYGDNMDFSNANYKNTSSSLNLRCKIHNLYFQNTAYHLVRGAGCRECRRENNIKSLGYNFVSIWESEYNDKKTI